MTMFKKSAAAALTIATIATAATFGNVETAEAGNGKFWAGVGAGVVAGAIIHHNTRPRYYQPAPVYVAPAPRASNWDAHVSYCYNRYRSYSHHDNAFTTRRGFRKTCRSPYL